MLSGPIANINISVPNTVWKSVDKLSAVSPGGVWEAAAGAGTPSCPGPAFQSCLLPENPRPFINSSAGRETERYVSVTVGISVPLLGGCVGYGVSQASGLGPGQALPA